MAIKKGDLIRFKPEWCDPGDELEDFIAMEDEDGGRLKVSSESLARQFFTPPIQVVEVQMIETVNGRAL